MQVWKAKLKLSYDPSYNWGQGLRKSHNATYGRRIEDFDVTEIGYMIFNWPLTASLCLQVLVNLVIKPQFECNQFNSSYYPIIVCLKLEVELVKLQDVMAKIRSYSELFLKRGFVCIVS